MSQHPVIEDLEGRFLQRLEDLAAALRSEFPHVEIGVWSSSVGSLTDYQGHDLGIDCAIPDVAPDKPDNIALILEVMHLATEPKLCGAAVVWGHPSGAVEADLMEREAEPYDGPAIAVVERRLDELVDALREALRRGAPNSQTRE